ncbi:MAG: VCBS repeat-containing protein [Acidobacteria bacterium]|nr:VCBS repeat-containing protein [Acidobacteriota bacterium]
MIKARTVSTYLTLLALAGTLLSAACASAAQKPEAAAPKETASAPKSDAPAAEAAKAESAAAAPAQADADDDAPEGMNPMAGEPLAASWADYQPQPPDGVWLVDLEGREYFVQPIEKREGEFIRTGPNQVRVKPGIPLNLEREDDSYFYVKVFNKGTGTGPAPAKLASQMTPEERAKIAKEYEVATPVSNDLTFTELGAGLPKERQWRNGFAIADVDGDGALDIIHGTPRRTLGAKPSIFRGDGKGGFTKWQGLSWPNYPYDYGDAAAGDFNKDGKIDLAFGIHLRGIVAMLGDGKGNFTPFSDGLEMSNPEIKTWSANPFTSRALEIVDWNRDGRDDILAVSEGPARAGGSTSPYAPGKRIYLAGEKGWSPAEGSGAADSTIGDTVALGDFNADGRTDFLTGVSLSGTNTVLNLASPKGTGWTVATVDSIRQAAFVRAVAAHDFNGDRRDDMVISWLNNHGGTPRVGIDVMLTQPGGWQRVGLWGRDGRKGIRSLATGDLDGDGNMDIVGFTDDQQPVILKGLGKGKFSLESADGIALPIDECAGYHVMLADIDNDGKDEIVAGFAGEKCATQGSLRAWKAGPQSAP